MADLSIPEDASVGWRAVRWCLRVTVAVQCLGLARESQLAGTPMVSWLCNPPDIGGWGFSEAAALGVDGAVGWGMLGAAVLVLVRPWWPVLGLVVLWQLLISLAGMLMGGAFLSELTVPAHATRILAPLALIALESRRGELSLARREAGLWLLRGAAAVTFAIHGWEALRLHPGFVDYLIIASQRLLDYPLQQSAAETLLKVIGGIDLVLALLVLTTRWRSVVWYMAFWGAVTAACRVVCADWSVHPQMLVRAANAGVPLALALYWTYVIPSRLKISAGAPADVDSARSQPVASAAHSGAAARPV